MRPKKRVLCCCADEAVLSRRVFLLETHGFRCERAQTAAEAERTIAERPTRTFDLVLIDEPMAEISALAAAAYRLEPELRVLAVSSKLAAEPDVKFMVVPQNFTALVVEWVKQLVARKPGPKKHERKPVQSVRPAADEMAVRA